MVEVPRHAAASLAAALRAGAFVTIVVSAASFGLSGANGDQLVIESDDLACPVGPTSMHGTGHWHVVRGTGRFSGATGEGSFDGVAVFGPSFSPAHSRSLRASVRCHA